MKLRHVTLIIKRIYKYIKTQNLVKMASPHFFQNIYIYIYIYFKILILILFFIFFLFFIIIVSDVCHNVIGSDVAY
jgi:hypothetical protein